MKLTGHTVLVTGGTSGIGAALAAELTRRGNTVLVTGRGADAPYRCDVREPASVDALLARVREEHPRLDMLVNNAGVMNKLDLQKPIGEEALEEIETNLTGTIRMVLRFLPLLRAQPEAAIVNVSSGLAFAPYPIAPIYGATKAAVHSFTQSLRVQLGRTNVKVFELVPPAVDTPLNHKFAAELKGTPLITTEALVREAVRGIEKDRLEIRVGFANVARIMSRLAPGLILKMLSKPVEQMRALNP